MAIVDKSGSIIGRLGDLRYYTLNGKNIVATKGGPTANNHKAIYCSTLKTFDFFGFANKYFIFELTFDGIDSWVFQTLTSRCFKTFN